MMADFSINEMQEMQRLLQDKYKDKWEPIGPETGKNKLLWMVGEIGEVVDIVKKLWEQKDVDKIVNELYKASIENWKKENCNIDDITIICVILN